ncbi:MAG TPA: hypothetical protein VI564_00235 [Candidatus Nanoarchaeia archaeon]|nr:hypothetical protein [Candidatus Nanoarchaeia archaeon]
MGFRWSSRRGEGVNITGNSVSIDVIVKEIGGSTRYRTAEIEVVNGGKRKTVPLRYDSEFVDLNEDVHVKIAERIHVKSDQVCLIYEAREGYIINPTTYSIAEF